MEFIDVNIIETPSFKSSIEHLAKDIDVNNTLDTFNTINISSEVSDWFNDDAYLDGARKKNTFYKLDLILSEIIKSKWISSAITHVHVFKIYEIIQQFEMNKSLNIKGVQQLNTFFTDDIKVFT